MAFRAVRTAAMLSLPLLVLVGCGPGAEMDSAGTDTVTVIPDDTVRLSADQLARLPLYGVQTLPCREVREQLMPGDDTSRTRSVRVALEEGDLVVRPRQVSGRLGGSVRWQVDSVLLWTVRFKNRSPLRRGGLETRGRGAGRSAITADSSRCGHYVYQVAAYHPERDSVYVADPIFWVY